ncbi:unnamed protein product, partial [Polarella glacialis]
ILRRRYDRTMEKLNPDSKPKSIPQESDHPEPVSRRGVNLALTDSLDMDDLFASARQPPQRAPAPAVKNNIDVVMEEVFGAEDDKEGDEGIAEYLTEVQKRSKKADKFSKRVVKSVEERKQDYEDTKDRIMVITAG